MVVGLMELISEVQVFAEKSGLGTALMEKFIGDMFGPVAESYSKRYCICLKFLARLTFADLQQEHMHPHSIHRQDLRLVSL
jgi:hypothetical protein